MILLTDKEIDEAMEYAIDWAQDYTIRNGKVDSIPERQVALAQLKKVVEWLNGSCEHSKTQTFGTISKRDWCDLCWQALLKEAKDD